MHTRGRAILLIAGVVVLAAGVAAGLPGTHAPDGQAPAKTVATAPGQPSLAHVNGTTNYLQVPDEDVRTAGIHRASVDVTASTRISTDELELEIAAESFETRFENADTEAERTAAVREIVGTLDAKTEANHERQDNGLDRFNSGDRTANHFIGVLARVDATGERIQGVAERVTTTGETTLDYSIPPALKTKLRNYEADVLQTKGLLRKVEFRPAISGSGLSRPTYVETGNESVVVATVVNDRYVREGFTAAATDSDGDPQLRTFRDALDRLSELYPWAMAAENRNQPPRVNTLRGASVFDVDISHAQGDMNVYLDAVTTDVFKERQTRDLTRVPAAKTFVNATGRTSVTVNATHDTGPVQVTVTRLTTNEGVPSAVFVDDTYVGSTGSDGELWTVDTRDTTTIRVITNDEEHFTVTVPAESIPG